MLGDSLKNLDRIEKKAKQDHRHADKATEVVDKAITEMNPQRQHSEDPSQNKR
ncbi:hypothetical protein [Halalkalibacter urbisdiaboli]|uniref:hypothetical protein n=1 Tax=Halalkalibacter urbisdiaboli TaxID=1960589 RepID=UPI0013FD8BBD|nr:hypothetical protein [Halalkalibacter urbisdiaboli]